MDRKTHWDSIHRTRSPDEVSWYEATPALSLRLVRRAIDAGARSVIDIGGGASRLVDHLVDLSLSRLVVLDVSSSAIEISRARLGDAAERVEWIVGDVAEVRDLGTFDVWHDRAVFHFLTERSEQDAYVALCERTVDPSGVAIVATFA
ncbi:MAG: class I SAM-dependent methyltransferase, partial [Actinomycetota bacterium]